MNEQTKQTQNPTMTPHQYRNHPVADLFPAMSEKEFDELKKSIQQVGQLQPIVVDGDQLLDGRHRLRACIELGVEPKVIQFAELGLATTPAAWILSTNAHRRNITADQKLAILAAFDVWELQAHTQPAAGQTTASGTEDSKPDAAASEAEFPGRNQPKKTSSKRRRGRPPGTGSGRKREQLAKSAVQSQYRARQMLKLRKEMPELAAEVEAGRITLKEAMRQCAQRQQPQQDHSTSTSGTEAANGNGDEPALMPLAYGVSIVTILMTVDLIMEYKDTSPGKEQRRQQVAELVREFQAITDLEGVAAQG
jgi:hypothetical protein